MIKRTSSALNLRSGFPHDDARATQSIAGLKFVLRGV